VTAAVAQKVEVGQQLQQSCELVRGGVRCVHAACYPSFLKWYLGAHPFVSTAAACRKAAVAGSERGTAGAAAHPVLSAMQAAQLIYAVDSLRDQN
jgi:hypothetical protein